MEAFILGKGCQKYSSVMWGWGQGLGLHHQCPPKWRGPGSGRAWTQSLGKEKRSQGWEWLPVRGWGKRWGTLGRGRHTLSPASDGLQVQQILLHTTSLAEPGAPCPPPGQNLGQLTPTPLPPSLCHPRASSGCWGGGQALKLNRGKFSVVFVKWDGSVRSTQRTESTTGQAREWKGRGSDTQREERDR